VGPSPPVPEPAEMEGVHYRRFVSGTIGEDLFPIKKYFHIIILHHLYNIYNI